MSAEIMIAFSFLHLFELVRVSSENVTISDETCAFQDFNLSLHHSVRNFVDERISNNSVECKETCCLAKLCDHALFVPRKLGLVNCSTALLINLVNARWETKLICKRCTKW